MNNRINYQVLGIVMLALALGSLCNAKGAENGSRACQIGKYMQSRVDNDGDDDCNGNPDNDGDGEAIPRRLKLGI
jgi:hypothetical protein